VCNGVETVSLSNISSEQILVEELEKFQQLPQAEASKVSEGMADFLSLAYAIAFKEFVTSLELSTAESNGRSFGAAIMASIILAGNELDMSQNECQSHVLAFLWGTPNLGLGDPAVQGSTLFYSKMVRKHLSDTNSLLTGGTGIIYRRYRSCRYCRSKSYSIRALCTYSSDVIRDDPFSLYDQFTRTRR
jgi:hypothetical protein